jgi:RNA polymerase-binding protein DksA
MPSAKEIERLKKSLLTSRSKIVDNTEHLEQDVHTNTVGGGVKFNHMADAGSDTFEMDFSMEQLENKENLIYDIDEALRKMEAGTYGECEECGKKITLERLRAIPFTTKCLPCQEESEEI